MTLSVPWNKGVRFSSKWVLRQRIMRSRRRLRNSFRNGKATSCFSARLRGETDHGDVVRFAGHMLMEMARMSVDDGLVMQIHPGSYRNHNDRVYQRFGRDMGADIPLATEYTRNLHPLLNEYGNERGFTLILFTLDETTFAREFAPLAGHYPAVSSGRLGGFMTVGTG